MARARGRKPRKGAGRKKVAVVTVKDVAKVLADVELRIRACRKWVAAQPEDVHIKDLTKTLKEIQLRILTDVEVRVHTVRKLMAAPTLAISRPSLISAGQC